mgnify:CR=1 FL=1
MDNSYNTHIPNAFVENQPVCPARRVGTFTLGVALILLGILVPAALYLGKGAWQLLLLSPVVLLCLGAEILFYAIRHKDTKYKYDGLSVFLVILITFGTLICSGIAKVATSAAVYSQQIEESRSITVNTAEKALADNNCTGNVHGTHFTSSHEVIPAILNDKKKVIWPVGVDIEFVTINGSESPDDEQIIKTFADIATACKNENLERLSMRFSREDTEYTVSLYGGAISNTNTVDMQSRINIYGGDE